MKFFPIEIFPAYANNMHKRVYLKNGPNVWMGYRDETGWKDAANASGNAVNADGKAAIARGHDNELLLSQLRGHKAIPLEWAPALPEFYVPLAEEVDEAGRQLERAVEDLPIQGAMWTHSPNHGAIFATVKDGLIKGYPRQRGWRYLLVTPDVALVRDRLPEIFRSGKVSQAMVIDDVDIVGPDDPMFILLEYWGAAQGNSTVVYEGTQNVQTLVRDGTLIFCEMRCNAVVYKASKTLDGSDVGPSPEDLEMFRKLLAGSKMLN